MSRSHIFNITEKERTEYHVLRLASLSSHSAQDELRFAIDAPKFKPHGHCRHLLHLHVNVSLKK